MKFIAQPYYDLNQVKIFSLPGANLVSTIDLVSPGSGPNGVVLFQDPSAGTSLMFVSFDMVTSGAVDLYTFDASLQTATFQKSIAPDDPAVGMAIQPGTGDLFIATFGTGSGQGGVLRYTRASGYTTKTQYISFTSGPNNAAKFCANLAFDPRGRLWMTTFDGGGQFLICFTDLTSTTATSDRFVKFSNGGFTFAATKVLTLPGSSASAPSNLFLLSQPEGIAFDPLGNLWLANNDDDFQVNGGRQGTLVSFSQATLETALAAAMKLPLNLTADGYRGTQSFPTGDTGIAMYYMAGARFGGLFFDGFTLYLNDQSDQTQPGFDPSNAVVWKAETDLLPVISTDAFPPNSFVPSGITTRYPGNGTMAVFSSATPSLLIRDTATDTGVEPDTAAGIFLWESPDIGVTNSSIGGLPPPNSVSPTSLNLVSDETILAGSAFVYVRVANIGTIDTSGTEILKVYWAKGSAGLNWPAPWDGSRFDTMGAMLAFGGLVGVQKLGLISPGHETVFQIPWPHAPNSALFGVKDTHFCLIARIETASVYPFGMHSPEQVNGVGETALAANVRSNSRIGWRNVAIIGTASMRQGPDGRAHVELGILGANHASVEGKFAFLIETLNEHGRPADLGGVVHLQADGPTLRRLLEAKLAEQHIRFLGDGRFHLLNPAEALRQIHLDAGDVLPFHVEYTPAEDVKHFAVRVIQYSHDRGGLHVVGGQTFVVGKVKGFPAREAKHY